METIRNVAASISVSAVVISAVYILCPDGKQGKSIRFVAGLLMLLAVITPFSGASFSLPEVDENPSFDTTAEQMLKVEAEYLISSVLRSENIEFSRIEPFMDISAAGDISIYRISVYGVREKQRAAALLAENFPGCEVVINE